MLTQTMRINKRANTIKRKLSKLSSFVRDFWRSAVAAKDFAPRQEQIRTAGCRGGRSKGREGRDRERKRKGVRRKTRRRRWRRNLPLIHLAASFDADRGFALYYRVVAKWQIHSRLAVRLLWLRNVAQDRTGRTSFQRRQSILRMYFVADYLREAICSPNLWKSISRSKLEKLA